MTPEDIPNAVAVDEAMLTLEELALACAVEPRWIELRVEAGLLECAPGATTPLRFASAQLVRARRMAALERDFEANEELAALVADLIEEVQRLRVQLKALGGD